MENIEIKASCWSLDRARDVAADLGARRAATITQTDTYFDVAAGRLKLREQDPGPDQLIFYTRPDRPTAKLSQYRTALVSDTPATISLLSEALRVRVRVHKRRELWCLDNVRIHLDVVDELGTYLEFEVMVIEGHSEADCRRRAEALIQAFAISAADLISSSYADLLEQLR